MKLKPSVRLEPTGLYVGVDPATGADYSASVVRVPPDAEYTPEEVDQAVQEAIATGLVEPPVWIYFHDKGPGMVGVTPKNQEEPA